MSKPDPNVAQLVADPCWHVHGISDDLSRLTFLRVERSTLTAAPFLDERLPAPATALRTAAAADIERVPGVARVAPNFLFHTAFCCSTLLARCLDLPGTNLSLKEPRVLMDLGNARRMMEPARIGTFQRSLGLAIRLLARPFVEGERVLVKPANVANNILGDILAASPGSRCVFLYSDLAGFLVSILKKGEAGRSFARHLFNIFALDHAMLRAIDHRAAMRLTDLQAAALVWLAQADYVLRALTADPARCRSLHCDVFLQRPSETLAAAANFLGLEFPRAALDAVASGPLFAHDSKNAERRHDAAARAREAQDMRARHGDSINATLDWARQWNAGRALPSRLPNPLHAS